MNEIFLTNQIILSLDTINTTRQQNQIKQDNQRINDIPKFTNIIEESLLNHLIQLKSLQIQQDRQTKININPTNELHRLITDIIISDLDGDLFLFNLHPKVRH